MKAMEDQQPHGFTNLGHIKSPIDKRDFTLAKVNTLLGAVPPIVPVSYFTDLSKVPVLMQSQQPSCIGHATASGMMSQDNDAYSEDYSPRFLYALCKRDDGLPNQDGTFYRQALKEGQQYGVCDNAQFPNDVILPPASTDTHKPIAHAELIANVIDGLSYRHINVVRDEYAVSEDGMKLFGILELATGFDGASFALGIRNANDKSMRLALTVGYRVFVCDNMAFHGDFTPVLAKHSKHFNLQDALAIGIDRMQRNFAPMQKQVESWRQFQLTDAAAKLIIYHAFIEDALEAPKHLARHVNDLYFEPKHDEFRERTFWSLSNAFTSAFKELDPIPQFKATAKLGAFLTAVRA